MYDKESAKVRELEEADHEKLLGHAEDFELCCVKCRATESSQQMGGMV